MAKKDVVSALCDTITEEQWELISQLRGVPVPENKTNFINNLFTKTRSKASAKSIARSLQQWTCEQISRITGIAWGKDEEIASREMGQSGADVRMSRNVYGKFKFTIECKSGNKWNIPAAIKQCKNNLYEDTDWMIILDRPHQRKEERIPPIVVIDGDVFFNKILKENK
jgi:hypothetical protein